MGGGERGEGVKIDASNPSVSAAAAMEAVGAGVSAADACAVHISSVGRGEGRSPLVGFTGRSVAFLYFQGWRKI